jgi:urease accessory protein
VKHTVTAEPEAQLDLSFVRRGGRTVIDRRLFRWPFVLTRSFAGRTPTPHMLTVIVQTGSGAIHGEDRLTQRLAVGVDAAVHVTNQGATAIHRAGPGQQTEERAVLQVEPGGVLEYLPEPRILFPDAAISQTVELDCAAGSEAIVADAFVPHDPFGASGRFRSYEATLTVRGGGSEPLLVDRLRLDGSDVAPRHSAFGSVTMVLAKEATACVAQAITARLSDLPGLYGAATVLPSSLGVGVRLVGEDLRAIRLGIAMALALFRETHSEGSHTPSASRQDGA